MGGRGGGVVEAEALQPMVRDDAAIAARVNTSFVLCVCVYRGGWWGGGVVFGAPLTLAAEEPVPCEEARLGPEGRQTHN